MNSDHFPSRDLVEGPARAPARAMLRAAGMDDEALARPMVAIVNSWSTVTPCNIHLRALADHARRGSRRRAAPPVDFNTIVVTDGIAMGTPGHARLADQPRGDRRLAELAVRGHCLDGVLFLVGCDKTIPAAAMAAARLDLPCVILYGGSIMPGHVRRQGDHHPGRVRGGRRAQRRHDRRRRTERGRRRRLPRRRRLRRPVHRQHDGAGDDLPRPLADGPQRRSPPSIPARARPPRKPGGSWSRRCAPAATRAA